MQVISVGSNHSYGISESLGLVDLGAFSLAQSS